MYAKIGEIIDLIKNEVKCTLLIGAGCSVKAGIPVAGGKGGFIEILKKRFESSCNKPGVETYQECLKQLPVGMRRQILGEYIGKAKINWAHICIAQLIKNGFVDMVLTTNFDPLVIKACALAREFPAVYDFAVPQKFESSFLAEKSVFYLHGQSDGFTLIHTDRESNELSEQHGKVFRKAAEIKTESGAYNLACISALEKNGPECRKWLNVCNKNNTLPDLRSFKN